MRSTKKPGVDHPKLAAQGLAWTLTYSWSGGMGPGTVTFVLNSDGRAILTSKRHFEPHPSVSDYDVGDDEIVRIARVVDQTKLLSQDVHPREGHVVRDLERFSVTVSSGDFSRTVFIDERHTIADPKALSKVRQALISMKPRLPESIAWGPYGTATVSA
jgi:hypothetical protein